MHSVIISVPINCPLFFFGPKTEILAAIKSYRNSVLCCVGSKLPHKHNDFHRQKTTYYVAKMLVSLNLFQQGKRGKGRREMRFKNIENKGRFIKNSNLGSTGSYK